MVPTNAGEPPALRFDIVAGLTAAVGVVRRSGLADHLGDRMLFNAHAAMERYQASRAAR